MKRGKVAQRLDEAVNTEHALLGLNHRQVAVVQIKRVLRSRACAVKNITRPDHLVVAGMDHLPGSLRG